MILSIYVTFLISAALALPSKFNIQSPIQTTTTAIDQSIKVPIILGVMSACPDAALCESVFDDVFDLVGNLVDVNLIYIAKLNSTSKYGVSCMHGELECDGNVQQLCAAKYWRGSEDEVKPWIDNWNFVQCMNFGPRTDIGKLETAIRCAALVNREWSGEVVECSEGAEGSNLLQESLTTAQELSIQKSCTMLINGKQVCIHDGTWKECEGGHTPTDFSKQIKEVWNELNQS